MRFICMLCVLFLSLVVKPAVAEDSYDLKTFKTLPILHEGRYKPIDTFARVQLRLLSGKESYNGQSASEWLFHTIFNPQGAMQDQIFRVDNPLVRNKLGLDESQRVFSFAELQDGLRATQEQAFSLVSREGQSLSGLEKDFLHLHENAINFSQLIGALSLLAPLDIEIPDHYKPLINPRDDQYSFFDLNILSVKVQEDLEGIIQEKGEDIDRYNEKEISVVQLSYILQNLAVSSQENALFRVIPSLQNNQTKFFAPWQIVNEGLGNDKSVEALNLWRQGLQDYNNNNSKQFNETLLEIKAQSLNIIAEEGVDFYPDLEILLNTLDPYMLAIALYSLSFVLALIAMRVPNMRFPNLAAFLSLLFAIGFHSFGLVSKIIVLGRPAIGTLYESVVFVALVCAIIGALLYVLKRENFYILCSSLLAVSLFFVSYFIAPSGDDREVLVAVLNSNFWLATHVKVITIGYGLCLLCAILGHVHLVQRWFKKDGEKVFGTMRILSLYALLFTAVGTVLGGIWADQSWGRFWGWDPKENGALLIVLWLIWIQHGLISGHLNRLPFSALMACLSIIVAVAWFGVNLLAVGLHSYGFIEGLGSGLAAFTFVQLLVIMGLYYKAKLSNVRIGLS